MPDKDKVVIKGTTRKIDTKGEKQKITDIKEFSQRQKDRSGLRNIRDAAKKLEKAGEEKKAKDLLKKAVKSAAFKRITKNVAKSALKSVPIIGGIITALGTKDASAAVPVLGSASTTGPKSGSPSAILEDPKSSPEEKRQARKILEKRRKNREGK